MSMSTHEMTGKEDGKLKNLGSPSPSLAQKAREAVSTLGVKTTEAAASVAETAEDAASYVGQRAEAATAAVGDGLESLGNSLRTHTPQTGMAGAASAAVANTLENTGRYLQEEGLQGSAEHVTALIRRNPLAALAIGIGIGVGVGLMLGRVSTRRS